jgi:hypothetical protein
MKKILIICGVIIVCSLILYLVLLTFYAPNGKVNKAKIDYSTSGLATLFWTKLLRTRNYFNYSSYPADFRVFNPLYSTGVR